MSPVKDFKDLHILFADDEKFYMRGTIESLQTQVSQLIVVTNGAQVLQYLRENQNNLPNIIVLDIMMPEGSLEIKTNDCGRSTGIVVYKKIREELGLSIPIIISTVVNDPKIISEFNRDRRMEIINKPYPIAELINKIQTLLELEQGN